LNRHITREHLWFYLLTAPTLIGFAVLTLIPMVLSLVLSFTAYDIVTPPRWIGLQNYEYLLFDDPAFWSSIRVTVVFAVIQVPLSLVTALGVAMLLNADVKLIGLFRTVYFLPSLLPPTASAVIFIYLFNAEHGLLNETIRALGGSGVAWLNSTTWALPTLIIISLWGFGNAMLIFLGGLQGVSRSLLEAASLDGAGAIRRFVHVTLPQISPIFFFNLTMGLIGSLKVFDLAYAFGAAQGAVPGGPARATLFYVLYLFQNAFTYFHFGLGSAMAWLLFGVILLITGANFFVARYWVHYEN
jgi:multiple sugar transport system permease protein